MSDEMVGIRPYSPWYPKPGRLTVDTEPMYDETVNFQSGVRGLQRTGRIRIVIEGERKLVIELLGKNWLRRCERIMQRLKDEL